MGNVPSCMHKPKCIGSIESQSDVSENETPNKLDFEDKPPNLKMEGAKSTSKNEDIELARLSLSSTNTKKSEHLSSKEKVKDSESDTDSSQDSDDLDDSGPNWLEPDPVPPRIRPPRKEKPEHWRMLPPEIWSEIFKELDQESLLNATIACKEWNEMYRNDPHFTSIICINGNHYRPMEDFFTYENEKDETVMDMDKINDLISGFPKLRRFYIDLQREGNEIKDLNEIPVYLDITNCPDLDDVAFDCATRPENALWNPENADGRFRTIRDLLITVSFDPQVKKDKLTSLDVSEFAVDGIRPQQTELLEFLRINKFKILTFLDLQGMWFTSRKCMNYFLDAAINEDVKQHLKECWVRCYRYKEDDVEEMLKERFTKEEFPNYERSAVQGNKKPWLDRHNSGDEYFTDTSDDELNYHRYYM